MEENNTTQPNQNTNLNPIGSSTTAASSGSKTMTLVSVLLGVLLLGAVSFIVYDKVIADDSQKNKPAQDEKPTTNPDKYTQEDLVGVYITNNAEAILEKCSPEDAPPISIALKSDDTFTISTLYPCSEPDAIMGTYTLAKDILTITPTHEFYDYSEHPIASNSPAKNISVSIVDEDTLILTNPSKQQFVLNKTTDSVSPLED